jgi:hypothetical protein
VLRGKALPAPKIPTDHITVHGMALLVEEHNPVAQLCFVLTKWLTQM